MHGTLAKSAQRGAHGWDIADARDRVSVDVYDPLGLGREAEPVEVTLRFGVVRPSPEGIVLVDDEGRPVPSQMVASSGGDDGRLDFATLCFLADLPEGVLSRRYYVYLADSSLAGSRPGRGSASSPPSSAMASAGSTPAPTSSSSAAARRPATAAASGAFAISSTSARASI